MTQIDVPLVSYNLWLEPWLTVEREDGHHEQVSIENALKCAHQFRTVAAFSPLEVVGIHRFLTAIVQSVLSPQTFNDLKDILQLGAFQVEAIDAFRQKYGNRFELFSLDQPFLQSSDLPLQPAKKSDTKTVSYLVPEFPSGTGVVHYNHSYDNDHYLCPACAARAMTVIPAFSTSGGAGIKPSINGVPPIYVIPGGNNLFESLSYSLVLPPYQPAQSAIMDMVWWDHASAVGKSEEVVEVGYLQSLTFPARRVRLHPVQGNAACTRCGEISVWGVRNMIFEMGQSQPKDAPFWRDPFAGYNQKGDKEPIPIRPTPGKATWREYSSLFLKKSSAGQPSPKNVPLRPALLDQLDDFFYNQSNTPPTLTLRCIGMRTDMKAKIFEWIDTGFDVPLALLQSSTAGQDVDDALDFAGRAVSFLSAIFQDLLNRSKKGTRFAHLKEAMRSEYWNNLADPFRQFTLNLSKIHDGSEGPSGTSWPILKEWYSTVVSHGVRVFDATVEQMGDDGHSLRLRYQAVNEAHKRLYGQLKKENEKHE